MEVDETSEKAIWNEVSTDFDPDEETANFGTRQALETAGSLYEVSQVDTIETVSLVTAVWPQWCVQVATIELIIRA